MPYSEVSFSGIVHQSGSADSGTRRVAASGNRNKRLIELNNPVHIQKFHVKDIAVPITWRNILKGTIGFEISTDLPYTYEYSFDFPASTLFGTTFTTTLQAAFRFATLANPSGGADPDITQITCAFDANGKLVITFPLALDPAGEVFTGVLIDWPESWKPIFNLPYDENFEAYSEIAAGRVYTSAFPMKLIPSHLLLHSNLMEAVHMNSSFIRAVGTHASRTILTKIPIDSTNVVYGQVLQWANQTLSTDLMFSCGSTEFNRLEFWFTDENGLLIDFNGEAFSLTLAVIHR